MPDSTASRPAVAVPASVIEAIADAVAHRLAALVSAHGSDGPSSPWMDFEAARAYLGFSKDGLYKLTAARAIPFRKRRGGQGLLFHRDELDRWLQAAYEPTGCAGQVELWSSTNQ